MNRKGKIVKLESGIKVRLTERKKSGCCKRCFFSDALRRKCSKTQHKILNTYDCFGGYFEEVKED